MSKSSVAAPSAPPKRPAPPSASERGALPPDTLGLLFNNDPTAPGSIARGWVHGAMIGHEMKKWREEPSLRDAPLESQLSTWQALAESYAVHLAYAEARAMAFALEVTTAKIPCTEARRQTQWTPAEVRMALAAERILVEVELGARPQTASLRWHTRAWRVLDHRMVLDASANAQKKRAAFRILTTVAKAEG